MIPLSRLRLRHIRRVLTSALGLSRVQALQPVEILHADGRLTVRAARAGIVAEYSCDAGASAPSGSLCVPFGLFTDCQGGSTDLVSIRQRDDQSLAAEWTEHGMPTLRTYASLELAAAPSLVVPAGDFTDASSELLPALAAAAETCDPTSLRYALGCIQLRGNQGEIVATDGRQVLVQAGFALGFSEELLIQSSQLFACRDLQGQPASLARTEQYLVLRSGGWTFWLPLEAERRFPRIDDIVPRPQDATTHVLIPVGDAAFLAERLAHLPCDESSNQPVTVDLNGCVAIRGTSADRTATTELVLSNAHRKGEEVRFVTNRHYLERAVRLGLSDMYVYGPQRPVLCSDERRKLVWALLEGSDAALPSASAARVESPSLPTESSSRARVVMPRTEAVQQRSSSTEKEPLRATSSLEHAKDLQRALRMASNSAGELIRSLEHEAQSPTSPKSRQRGHRRLRTVLPWQQQSVGTS